MKVVLGPITLRTRTPSSKHICFRAHLCVNNPLTSSVKILYSYHMENHPMPHTPNSWFSSSYVQQNQQLPAIADMALPILWHKNSSKKTAVMLTISPMKPLPQQPENGEGHVGYNWQLLILLHIWRKKSRVGSFWHGVVLHMVWVQNLYWRGEGVVDSKVSTETDVFRWWNSLVMKVRGPRTASIWKVWYTKTLSIEGSGSTGLDLRVALGDTFACHLNLKEDDTFLV